MFKSLTSLEIIDCQNFKRLPDELGNLAYLKVLRVKGTAIREVPETLGQLFSLEYLELSNNNLERILESLDQLSSLESFELFEKNLDRIPEYLRSFPTGIPSKLTSLTLSVDLRNCLKLDPDELSEIVKDGWVKRSSRGEGWITKSMYFPGNEIPKWFRHQSTGSSITFRTPQPPALSRYKLMAVGFCAVVAFRSVEDDGERDLFDVVCDWGLCSRHLGKISYVESDHVFLGSYLLGRRFGYIHGVSFHIKGAYGHPECCEVKKCGIHMAWAQDSMESTKEEEEPHPKIPKHSLTPSWLIIP